MNSAVTRSSLTLLFDRLSSLQESKLKRYVITLLITLCAVLIQELINPFTGLEVGFIPLFALIMINTWIGGFGPALLTIIFGLVWRTLFDEGASFDLHTSFFILETMLCSLLILALKKTERERIDMLQYAQAAQAAAEKANESKDQFLAFVSHELRTPITAIQGWMHLLKSGKLNVDDTARAIDTIDRNANLQAQLIQDLLDLSRIVNDKLHMNMRQIELNSVLRSAVDVVWPAVENKQIDLRCNFDDQIYLVNGDHNRLQQVFWNILTNAVKFTPRGGLIEIYAQRAGSLVNITIKDNGIGISAELLPHIFDSFRQGEGAQVFGGLGIGMAIVRHIVDLHEGKISVDSKGKDQGSIFIINLPLISSQLNSINQSEA